MCRAPACPIMQSSNYKVRLADGTEEARAICLLDCTQTPRDANGDYLATVEDSGIVNAKLMIWDG